MLFNENVSINGPAVQKQHRIHHGKERQRFRLSRAASASSRDNGK